MRSRRGFGRIEALVGLVIAGLLAWFATPEVQQLRRTSRRAEVPAAVDDLKVSVDRWRATHGAVPVVPPAPRPLEALDGEAVAWTLDPAWKDLWTPRPEGLRGSYRVESTETGYRITGACDVDDDGVPAVYEATEARYAVRTTPPEVY